MLPQLPWFLKTKFYAILQVLTQFLLQLAKKIMSQWEVYLLEKIYFNLHKGWSARKALKVIDNVNRVLAIELMAACQALELMRPKKGTKSIERIYEEVRKIVPFMEEDESLHSHIEDLTKKIDEGFLLRLVEEISSQNKKE